MPIRGVHVRCFNAPEPERLKQFGDLPRVVETTTDSTGSYSLNVFEKAWVIYEASGYETQVLHWPEDLAGTCELKKVMLEPVQTER